MGCPNSLNLTPYYQHKLTIISLVLVVMMLYVHGIYNEVELFRTSYVVKSVIARLSYRVINPTYFTISGLLFFKGVCAAADCLPKIKKRIRTVLVPFILWSAITILEQLVFAQIPAIRPYVNPNVLDHFLSWSEGLTFFFLRPAFFHLWFLRDLMVFVFLSPLLYWLIKKVRWYLAPVVLIATPPLIQWFGLEHLEIGFFILGGTIALFSDLESVRSWLSKPIVIIAAILYFGLSFTWDFLLPKQFAGEEYLCIFFSICGMITLWRGYDWLAQRPSSPVYNPILLAVTNFTFFIYLFHEPILFVIMQMNKAWLGVNAWSMTFLYLVNPLLLIVIAISVAVVLKKAMPKAYSILVGGRTVRHQARQ